MDYVVTRRPRIGAIVLFALALTCGVSPEGVAQTAERSSSQPRETESHSRRSPTAPVVSSGQQAGAMRYYGGPKSPMWRGP
jgi:hypothetical protein